MLEDEKDDDLVDEHTATEFLLLDTGQIRQPIQLKLSDGKTKNLVLCEATGVARDKFMTGNARKTKFVGGKPQGLTTYEGIQSSLLALVLFRMNEGETIESLPDFISTETHVLVGVDEINLLPARVQQVLFDRAMTMSGLDKQAKEAIKNASTGTEQNGSSGAA